MYHRSALALAPALAPEDVSGGIDPVTGLPNRPAFLAAAERLRRGNGTVAMMVLDVDDFTGLNEQHGLRTGDHVLRQLALRCLRAIASYGGRHALGRVGPDEFGLAWTCDDPFLVPEAEQIQGAADTVRRAVCGLYEVGAGRSLTLAVSIGVSLLADPDQEAADALLHAAAARRAGTAPAGAVQHYDQIEAHRRAVRALREDVMADRIQVAWQPKVDLASQTLVGLEALARWTGPAGQPVPPSVFIPMAERNGLISDLGDRVFERVLRQLALWHDQGLPMVPVAVNISAQQFQRPDLAPRVAAALERHGVPPQLIEFELTESVLLHDFEGALDMLAALREVGVSLAIDDFGTGYSSLAYLRRFPVHCLKLDRSFVGDMEHDLRTRDIIEAVVALAHKCEVRCIAEGVENAAQRDLLRAIGCDQAQGYLFDRPLTETQVRERLAGHRPWA